MLKGTRLGTHIFWWWPCQTQTMTAKMVSARALVIYSWSYAWVIFIWLYCVSLNFVQLFTALLWSEILVSPMVGSRLNNSGMRDGCARSIHSDSCLCQFWWNQDIFILLWWKGWPRCLLLWFVVLNIVLFKDFFLLLLLWPLFGRACARYGLPVPRDLDHVQEHHYVLRFVGTNLRNQAYHDLTEASGERGAANNVPAPPYTIDAVEAAIPWGAWGIAGLIPIIHCDRLGSSPLALQADMKLL